MHKWGLLLCLYESLRLQDAEWKALPGHRLSHHVPSLETREDWRAFLVPRNYFTVKKKIALNFSFAIKDTKTKFSNCQPLLLRWSL